MSVKRSFRERYLVTELATSERTRERVAAARRSTNRRSGDSSPALCFRRASSHSVELDAESIAACRATRERWADARGGVESGRWWTSHATTAVRRSRRDPPSAAEREWPRTGEPVAILFLLHILRPATLARIFPRPPRDSRFEERDSSSSLTHTDEALVALGGCVIRSLEGGIPRGEPRWIVWVFLGAWSTSGLSGALAISSAAGLSLAVLERRGARGARLPAFAALWLGWASPPRVPVWRFWPTGTRALYTTARNGPSADS